MLNSPESYTWMKVLTWHNIPDVLPCVMQSCVWLVEGVYYEEHGLSLPLKVSVKSRLEAPLRPSLCSNLCHNVSAQTPRINSYSSHFTALVPVPLLGLSQRYHITTTNMSDHNKSMNAKVKKGWPNCLRKQATNRIYLCLFTRTRRHLCVIHRHICVDE